MPSGIRTNRARPVMDKAARLLELAHRRQATRWPGYGCIADYHGGAYECDVVSPYTKSAGNLDASLMVLLQDWASDDVLRGPLLQERVKQSHDPRRQTNRRLKELLRQYFQLELRDVFATNVFPFVKGGPMKTSLPVRDLVRAAKEFALPQIEIIGPRIAVCLGKAAYNAVAMAADQRRARTLDDAIAAPFCFGTTEVWGQAHTGAVGTNYRNKDGVDRVSGDWMRMASAYKSRSAAWSAGSVNG